MLNVKMYWFCHKLSRFIYYHSGVTILSKYPNTLRNCFGTSKSRRTMSRTSIYVLHSAQSHIFKHLTWLSLLQFSNIPTQLRSSTSQQLFTHRTKLNLGKRTFSIAAPFIWKELPTTLKSCKTCESLASVCKNLKTYPAFPPLIKARWPFNLMTTLAHPLPLKIITDSVLIRFGVRVPEGLGAIDVLLLFLNNLYII